MKVIIDGQETAVSIDEGASFDDILNVLKLAVDKNGRIITAISIDGEALTEESNEKVSKGVASDFNEVEVSTDSPIELAEENLIEAKQYIDSFNKQLDDVIEVLQIGGEEDIYDIFVDGLKGIQNVLFLLDIVKQMLNIDFSEIKVEDQTADELIASFSETLNEFKTAIEDEDIVYLQDLLQYEVKPCLVNIKGVIDIMLAKVEASK